jgi:DNA-binding transcriptional regulator YiaG
MKVLKEYRKRHGLSQYELAKYLRMDQASVSFWESGKIKPSGPASVLLDLLITLDDDPRTIVAHGKPGNRAFVFPCE